MFLTLVATVKTAYDANVDYVDYVEKNNIPDNPMTILARFVLDIAHSTIVTQTESNGGDYRAVVDQPQNVKIPAAPNGVAHHSDWEQLPGRAYPERMVA